MAGKKQETKLQQDRSTAISDYPDDISDTTVTLSAEKIVPDVVDAVTDEVCMTIYYGDTAISNGLELGPESVANEPRVEISGAKGSDIFSLLLVDPDMPSPVNPKYKDTLYWMVNNISMKENFDQATFTVEYMSPDPTGHGKHRFVFLLYKHRDSYIQEEPPSKRVSFQTRAWAKEHHLGDPVAAVYFKLSLA